MSEPETGSAPGPETPRLLRTKLFTPRAHPDIVPRPRLLDRLSSGLSCKLTLVSAPAGFGKTTLLSNWIERVRETKPSHRFGWVSLDGRDNETGRFWSYFIAALQTCQPDLGASLLPILQAPQPPPVELLLTELINQVSLVPQELTLVLDDYHEIQAQPVHAGLAFLLDNLPPQLHLVIAGRADPPLPLPQYRVQRELVELYAGDLRFSQKEAAGLLNQVMGLNLSAEDIQALDRMTEGWVAGLQLAALSMQGVQDIPAFIRSFSGSHRYVFDYLAQEVLNRQTEPVKSFLLQTSILERLSADLCATVVDQGLDTDLMKANDQAVNASQQMLEQLEQANLLLVPLDQQRRWYRYHHLFAEFLQARLLQERGSEFAAQLHRKASRWYSQHGHSAEAVEHALAARDYDLALALITQFSEEMFRRSELNTLLRWLEAIPEPRLNADRTLSMAAAWALLATGQSERADRHLHAVENILGLPADGSASSLAAPPAVRTALAEVACIRATLAFNRMDLSEVIRLCRLAQEYISLDPSERALFQDLTSLKGVVSFNLAVAYEYSGEIQAAVETFRQAIDLNTANPHLVPMSISHLAQLQLVQGKLKQAQETYQQALQEAEKSEWTSPMSGIAYTGLGNLYYETNQLGQAEAFLRRGVELGRSWTQWEILIAGYFGLARVKIAQQDYPEAGSLLAELSELAQRLQVGWAHPAIAAQKALLSARMGDLDEARNWLRSASAAEFEISYPREGEAILLARVMMATGSWEAARQLLDSLQAGAQAGGRMGRLVEILALQAVVLSACDDPGLALDTLVRALRLALPEGFVRVFLDEGQAMADLLAQVSQRPLEPALLRYASHLRQQFAAQIPVAKEEAASGQAAQPRPVLSQPAQPFEALSERELDVLRLIAAGLTNQEIADRLVISLNTVKTHVKNILGRLGVSNRTQATARARELGIL